MSEDLLPPNATAQERALALATARFTAVPVVVREVSTPHDAPSEILPWLAWAFSVDDWFADWNDSQKRQAIARSVSVHRYKGTIGALREALLALGLEVRVIEWYQMEPPGEPYTFDLEIDARQFEVTRDNLLKMLQVVDVTKNLRSHLIGVVPGATFLPTLNLATTALFGVDTTIERHIEDLSLLMDAAANGFEATSAAVDLLHTLVHETMPASDFW